MAHVLVIDDDESVRDLVRTLLMLDGHEFTGAAGGIEGLQFFLSRPESFDLVITDLSMPDMNGEQVVSSLFKDSPNIKVLMFSGSGYEFASGQGLDGVQSRYPKVSVMEKPFTAKEFRGIIAQVLPEKSD